MKLVRVLAVALVLAGPARADVPVAVADIAPVASLVAQVMKGLDKPQAILPPGASPHHYAMRPSDADALAGADLVFWVGPALETWLQKPLTALAGPAKVVELLDAPGTVLWPLREAGEGGGPDPHAWLDPENGKAWLTAIAAALSAADPANAATYAANAAEGRDELTALEAEINDAITPVRTGRYVIPHDAYQYFERRFGIAPTAIVAMSDAADPGPARLAEVRAKVVAADVTCAFTEPQLSNRALETVLDGLDVRIVDIDPLGASLVPGASLYPGMLRALAAHMADCF